MEKIIEGKDIYFMDIVQDKIIVNDNYEGILVFDTKLNLLKQMKICNDISIYTSYIIGNNQIILFCPENEKIIYVNLEKYTSNIITINEDLAHIIQMKLYAIDEKKCIFITPQKEYIELLWEYGIMRIIDKSTELKYKEKSNNIVALNEKIKKVLDTDNDYINIDINEHLFSIVYEEKIVFYNGIKIEIIKSKKGYIFNNAKFAKKDCEIFLVVLSNDIEDNKISTISIFNI
ncbi:hypothetical protein [Clostridium butyricum]|uniref:hypothetical protein n=1 Tax=Clostridium butyricum TaxID=1492 RepID=UPI0013D4AD64|nr:hypothetical protein [Clostridium butyricum]MCQ2019381.1 hypothetical protein [Clostridium butyricum]MCQ2022823.1 hypothetical protein [Clostridium butyricum]NFB73527.1 hypothetical protein [Clostridium butyricum]NFB92909.1 hypothetical protein [Clostridium butyricum]UTY55128.1 hypothetical protein HNS01_18630 [Clostridium butyricum]